MQGMPDTAPCSLRGKLRRILRREFNMASATRFAVTLFPWVSGVFIWCDFCSLLEA